MANSIPIQNVYYLLCYAWNRLEQAAIADTGNLPTTKLADLFATVLCSGIDHLARRGLEKCFDTQHETLSGIRGRIDFAGSLRKNSFIQGKAVCVFDELSLNTIANGIIKTTVEQLLKYGELDRELRARLRAVARSLRDIKEIKLTSALFSKVQVSSNRAFYSFLLDVCEFVYNSWLVDEENGDRKFRDLSQTFLIETSRGSGPPGCRASSPRPASKIGFGVAFPAKGDLARNSSPELWR